nr:unnamed protein product [Digitaria exilis]
MRDPGQKERSALQSVVSQPSDMDDRTKRVNNFALPPEESVMRRLLHQPTTPPTKHCTEPSTRRRVGIGVVETFPHSATEPSSSQEGVEATAKPMKHASLSGIELTIDLVVMGLTEYGGGAGGAGAVRDSSGAWMLGDGGRAPGALGPFGSQGRQGRCRRCRRCDTGTPVAEAGKDVVDERRTSPRHGDGQRHYRRRRPTSSPSPSPLALMGCFDPALSPLCTRRRKCSRYGDCNFVSRTILSVANESNGTADRQAATTLAPPVGRVIRCSRYGDCNFVSRTILSVANESNGTADRQAATTLAPPGRAEPGLSRCLSAVPFDSSATFRIHDPIWYDPSTVCPDGNSVSVVLVPGPHGHGTIMGWHDVGPIRPVSSPSIPYKTSQTLIPLQPFPLPTTSRCLSPSSKLPPATASHPDVAAPHPPSALATGDRALRSCALHRCRGMATAGAVRSRHGIRVWRHQEPRLAPLPPGAAPGEDPQGAADGAAPAGSRAWRRQELRAVPSRRRF